MNSTAIPVGAGNGYFCLDAAQTYKPNATPSDAEMTKIKTRLEEFRTSDNIYEFFAPKPPPNFGQPSQTHQAQQPTTTTPPQPQTPPSESSPTPTETQPTTTTPPQPQSPPPLAKPSESSPPTTTTTTSNTTTPTTTEPSEPMVVDDEVEYIPPPTDYFPRRQPQPYTYIPPSKHQHESVSTTISTPVPPKETEDEIYEKKRAIELEQIRQRNLRQLQEAFEEFNKIYAQRKLTTLKEYTGPILPTTPPKKTTIDIDDSEPMQVDGGGDDTDEEEVYAVESILDRRKVDGILEYLVKWEGWKLEESTWVSADSCYCTKLIENSRSRRTKSYTAGAVVPDLKDAEEAKRIYDLEMEIKDIHRQLEELGEPDTDMLDNMGPRENRLEYIEYLASVKGFNSPSRWSLVKVSDFLDNHGRALLDQYEGSAALAVMDLVPRDDGQEWRIESFKNSDVRFWDHIPHQRCMLDQCLKINDLPVEPSSWYKMNMHSISANRVMVANVMSRYANLNEALVALYPEFTWNPQLLHMSVRRYSRSGGRTILASRLLESYPTPEDLYANLDPQAYVELASHDQPFVLVCDLLREHFTLHSWLFVKNFPWPSRALLAYLEWLAVDQGLQTAEDWYRVEIETLHPIFLISTPNVPVSIANTFYLLNIDPEKFIHLGPSNPDFIKAHDRAQLDHFMTKMEIKTPKDWYRVDYSHQIGELSLKDTSFSNLQQLLQRVYPDIDWETIVHETSYPVKEYMDSTLGRGEHHNYKNLYKLRAHQILKYTNQTITEPLALICKRLYPEYDLDSSLFETNWDTMTDAQILEIGNDLLGRYGLPYLTNFIDRNHITEKDGFRRFLTLKYGLGLEKKDGLEPMIRLLFPNSTIESLEHGTYFVKEEKLVIADRPSKLLKILSKDQYKYKINVRHEKRSENRFYVNLTTLMQEVYQAAPHLLENNPIFVTPSLPNHSRFPQKIGNQSSTKDPSNNNDE
eukprot:gene5666-6542_t